MIRKTTLAAFWTRFKRAARYYARGLYAEISEKDIFLWAQAIAFKVLVTIVPVIILATGIIGQVLRSSQPFDRVAGFARDFLPPEQSEQLLRFLSQLYGASSTITVFGAVGLFLSAWSLSTTLRVSVSNAFEQDWTESRSIVGGYLFDARMTVQVGLLFTLTIGFSLFARPLGSALTFGWLGLDVSWIHLGWQRALRVVSLITPLLISTAMFFQLFYFVPRPHPRKRSALVGALITALLWEVTKQGFTFYATYVGNFERYQGNGGEGFAALGNVFGLIIAFVFWVYFSALVLMLGAVIVSLHEDHVRNRPLPGAAPEKSAASDEPAPETTPSEQPPPPRHAPSP